jgi:hypothetical protein
VFHTTPNVYESYLALTRGLLIGQSYLSVRFVLFKCARKAAMFSMNVLQPGSASTTNTPTAHPDINDTGAVVEDSDWEDIEEPPPSKLDSTKFRPAISFGRLEPASDMTSRASFLTEGLRLDPSAFEQAVVSYWPQCKDL